MTGPELIRTIGRWTLAGLVLNGILGSAIYGLPSRVGGDLGAGAPLAWLLAALLIGVIAACFAEVSSRFTGAGGPYLYAHATFGRFAGIQTGWLTYLARLTAEHGLVTRTLAEVQYFNPAGVRLRTLLWPDPARDLETVLLVTNQ